MYWGGWLAYFGPYFSLLNDHRQAALQNISSFIQNAAEMFVRHIRLDQKVPSVWWPARAPVIPRPALRALYATRGPLCGALGCCAVLAMLPQAREIVRTLTLDASSEKGTIAVAAFTLVSLAIGLWSLSWSSSDATHNVRLRRALAGACAALPFAGASIGLWRAGVDVLPITIGQPEGAIDSGILAALSQTNALPGTLKSAAWAVAIGGLVTLAGLDLVVRRFMPDHVCVGRLFRSVSLGLHLSSFSSCRPSSHRGRSAALVSSCYSFCLPRLS
jgi:hypothetical protein